MAPGPEDPITDGLDDSEVSGCREAGRLGGAANNSMAFIAPEPGALNTDGSTCCALYDSREAGH